MVTAEVEVFVLVDEGGDYAVGADADAAGQAYADAIGGDNSIPKRLVRVVLTVPLPTVPTLTGTVPAEGDAVLTVA